MSYTLPKLLFIALFTMQGSAIPYLAIFYDQALHLSSDQIGILLAIAPFVQSVACPVWTLVADKWPKWHGTLMAVLALIGGSAIISMSFLPDLLDGKADLMMAFTCVLALMYAFFGSPLMALVDSAVLKILGNHKILYGEQRLWGSISNGLSILAVGLLISATGNNLSVAFYVFTAGTILFIALSLVSKVESNDYNLMDDDQDQDTRPLLKNSLASNYGWPPDQPADSEDDDIQSSVIPHHFVDRRDSRISFANTVLSDEHGPRTSLRLHRTSTSVARDVHLEASELMESLDRIPSLGLALSHIPSMESSLAFLIPHPEEDIVVPPSSSLKSRKVVTFLLSMLIFGVSFSMINQFLFLFLHNDLGVDSSILGWTGPVGGVTEVLTFWVSKQLFDTFGVTVLMVSAHCITITRSFLYTLLTPSSPWTSTFALALQTLNGIAFATVWSTAVSEVDTFFPPEQRAIAQGTLAALHMGAGFGIGCVVGGIIYEAFGAHILYQAASLLTGVSLITFLIGRIDIS
ncbi:major facilitator superfamily domain-containing protein [Umbelopsis sp. PMI_123]|nr:major facilitator superfamily domain-containing protein [Umbelopsis sp. PMI_123]